MNNLSKIINTIVYICKNTNSLKASKKKILKMLFLMDFEHIKEHTKPITYLDYNHLEYGPVPFPVLTILSNLIERKDDEVEKEVNEFKKCFEAKSHNLFPKKYSDKYFIVKRDVGFDSDDFSETELEVLKSICEKYYNYTANELEKITHQHRGYKNTSELETIDYRFGLESQADLDYFNYWMQEKKEFDIAFD